MTLSWLFVLLGLTLLFGGGEALVAGASRLARRTGVSTAVIGLTVVAFGTSVPELVVSVRSAWIGSPGLALGNVVGSNLFNLCAILGVAALVRPLAVRRQSLVFEWPIVLASSGLFVLAARDGELGRRQGLLLLAGLVAFVGASLVVGRREQAALATEAPPHHGSAWLEVLAVAGGIALLALGSTALVRGASEVALGLGVSETVVGLTIVAAGTSAPELTTSVVAALRGRDDVAVTNVLGSNVFNVLGIAGSVATLQPLAVPTEIVGRDGPLMLAATVLALPLLASGRRLSRPEGGLLCALFAGYLVLVLRDAGVFG